MSRVSKTEFDKNYRKSLYDYYENSFTLLVEVVTEAIIALADESGYIDDFNYREIYNNHVLAMDEESQEMNAGRYNNLVFITIMSVSIELMKLGYIEHMGRGDRASAWLCLPDKEA